MRLREMQCINATLIQMDVCHDSDDSEMFFRASDSQDPRQYLGQARTYLTEMS
jgi:hypothetical protein